MNHYKETLDNVYYFGYYYQVIVLFIIVIVISLSFNFIKHFNDELIVFFEMMENMYRLE